MTDILGGGEKKGAKNKNNMDYSFKVGKGLIDIMPMI
jgi:hypothetical protein